MGLTDTHTQYIYIYMYICIYTVYRYDIIWHYNSDWLPRLPLQMSCPCASRSSSFSAWGTNLCGTQGFMDG